MGAGKSSLVLRFVKGQFVEFQVSLFISSYSCLVEVADQEVFVFQMMNLLVYLSVGIDNWSSIFLTDLSS